MKKKTIRHRSREEWQGIIAGQEASGSSIPEYCRQQKLSEKSFYGWRKRLGVNAEPKPEKFIQVTSGEVGSWKVLNIKTPGGYQLEVPEGMDGAYVKSIVSVLK